MSKPPVVLRDLADKQPRSRIKMVCIPCGRTDYFTTKDVAGVFPAGATFEALRARATCKICGRRVDGDLVMLDLDLEPLSQEEAMARLWGGFSGRAY